MLSFEGKAPQSNGKTAYVYTVIGNIKEDADRIRRNADEPFSFQGQISGRTGNISTSKITDMLDRGGKVAGSAIVNGSQCTVRIMSEDEIVMIPSDGSQGTADMLAGVRSAGNDYDPYDDDFGNVFDDDSDFADEFDVPDPAPRRARSSDVPSRSEREPSTDPADQNVGKGEWFLMFVLLAIPIVNIIMLIVWLASKKTKKSKKNYLITCIIMFFLALCLSGAAIVLTGASLQSIIDDVRNVQILTGDDASEYLDMKNGTGNYNANVAYNGNANIENSNSSRYANASNENVSDEDNGTVNAVIDNISTTDSGDVRIAVATVTIQNNGTDPITPDSVVFDAKQGQNGLIEYDEPAEGYDPSTRDQEVQSGETGTFQKAWQLVDDQDVMITVADAQTNAQLDEESVDAR